MYSWFPLVLQSEAGGFPLCKKGILKCDFLTRVPPRNHFLNDLPPRKK